jgi:hypothetical protein
MTEKDLNQYMMINKEIDVLSKQLLQLRSNQLIKSQGFTEKLYLGPVIEKTVQELTAEINNVESIISDKIQELYKRRSGIERYINSIEDCEIRLILRLRYINCMTFSEISSELTVVDDNGEVLKGSLTSNGLSNKIHKFFEKQKA